REGCGRPPGGGDEQESSVAKSAEYTSKDIQVLEGLEAVRKRPGMYIGTTGSSGLHHLVYEVVDNAIDEALADRSTKIDVDLYDDGSVAVSDDGAGIPVTPIPGNKDKRPALEVVMTVLHAGGKFGGGGYQVSGGLHGVGVSVVNALSEQLRAEVRRDGGIFVQEFARGKPVTRLKRIGNAGDHGTTITFLADREIF